MVARKSRPARHHHFRTQWRLASPDVVTGSGYKTQQYTLFIWLGLTVYGEQIWTQPALKSRIWQPTRGLDDRRPPQRNQNLPLSPQGDDRPSVPVLVRFLLHLGGKSDCTHDSISKFFIQYRLIRITVILHNLIDPVDQWFLGRHIHRVTPKRKAGQEVFQFVVLNVENCR